MAQLSLSLSLSFFLPLHCCPATLSHRRPPASPPPRCSNVWLTDPITFFIGLSLARREGTSLSPEQRGKMAIVLLVEKMMATIPGVNKWCAENHFQTYTHLTANRRTETHTHKVRECNLALRNLCFSSGTWQKTQSSVQTFNQSPSLTLRANTLNMILQ